MQQALNLWKKEIPSYQLIIDKTIKELSKPVSFIPPADFDERIQALKSLYYNNEQEDYEYLDVILYFIQGQQNKSLIVLANQMEQKLGKDIKYWQNKIIDLAEYQVYADQLSLWEVRKQFDDFLLLAPESLSNLRRYRKISKNYINAVKNLIKTIKKTQNINDLNKIDQAFKKVKSAEQKYYAFIEQVEINIQYQHDQRSKNISTKAKNNAKKTLFYFYKPSQVSQKPKNTLPLQNYFTTNKQKASKPRLSLNKLTGQKLTKFEENIKTISQPSIQISQLRKQFYEDKIPKPVMNTYTSIYDNCYHFSYVLHPVQYKKIDYTNPFAQYDDVNYQINSQDEFNDLLGDDINSNLENQRSFSEENSQSDRSFLVSDDYLSDNEQSQKQVKITIQKYFEDPWSFNRESEFNLYTIVPLIQIPASFAQQPKSNALSIEELSKLVHNKTKKSIYQQWELQGKIQSKARINDFMKSNCYIVRNGRRTLYKVKDYETNLEVEPYEIIQMNSNSKFLSQNQQQTKLEDEQFDNSRVLKSRKNQGKKSKGRNSSRSQKNQKNSENILSDIIS